MFINQTFHTNNVHLHALVTLYQFIIGGSTNNRPISELLDLATVKPMMQCLLLSIKYCVSVDACESYLHFMIADN